MRIAANQSIQFLAFAVVLAAATGLLTVPVQCAAAAGSHSLYVALDSLALLQEASPDRVADDGPSRALTDDGSRQPEVKSPAPDGGSAKIDTVVTIAVDTIGAWSRPIWMALAPLQAPTSPLLGLLVGSEPPPP